MRRQLRIFLAARYSQIDAMKVIRDQIQANGDIVVSRWIDSGESNWMTPEGEKQAAHCPEDQRERWAIADTADVRYCDLLIIFPGGTRGGKYVEMGMAAAFGKKIIAVGEPENIFYYLPVVHRATMGSLFDVIEEVRKGML